MGFKGLKKGFEKFMEIVSILSINHHFGGAQKSSKQLWRKVSLPAFFIPLLTHLHPFLGTLSQHVFWLLMAEYGERGTFIQTLIS